MSFARSETEVEGYRFAAATLTRDLAPDELSESTGVRAWSGEPYCSLLLEPAAVPPHTGPRRARRSTSTSRPTPAPASTRCGACSPMASRTTPPAR
ncbi:MAG: hypothetical protein FJ137_21485 [Deltaproteobacteria bacterium]|nr:hypothetical protein [Deltaproteobacteria bacterium]